MILTAGLTPAWQQIILLERLDLGEVNRATDVQWCASGKALNAGLAVHHLGGAVRTLTPRGGPSGDAMARDMAALGIASRWTSMSQSTRVCTTLLEVPSGRTTELVQNGPRLLPDELEGFLAAYAEEAPYADVVVLSGSLAPGVPRTLYRDLVESTPSRVILDGRGPELLEALPARPLVVKPNRDELARTLGRDLRSDGDLREAMEETRRLGAEWVVVSRGTEPLLACGPGQFHTFRPPKVPTVNAIACGDCMAGAMAWALARGLEMSEAIRTGMGAAAQNASVVLPGRIDRETVERLAGSVG